MGSTLLHHGPLVETLMKGLVTVTWLHVQQSQFEGCFACKEQTA